MEVLTIMNVRNSSEVIFGVRKIQSPYPKHKETIKEIELDSITDLAITPSNLI